MSLVSLGLRHFLVWAPWVDDFVFFFFFLGGGVLWDMQQEVYFKVFLVYRPHHTFIHPSPPLTALS